jgi:hypothetical protein
MKNYLHNSYFCKYFTKSLCIIIGKQIITIVISVVCANSRGKIVRSQRGAAAGVPNFVYLISAGVSNFVYLISAGVPNFVYLIFILV